MDAAALAFLESPEARRIVAAWPIVARQKRGANIDSEWSRIAGVGLAVLRIHRTALERSKILLPGGAVDEAASQFIAAAAKSAARISSDVPIVVDTLTEPSAKRSPKKRGVIEWPED